MSEADSDLRTMTGCGSEYWIEELFPNGFYVPADDWSLEWDASYEVWTLSLIGDDGKASICLDKNALADMLHKIYEQVERT